LGFGIDEFCGDCGVGHDDGIDFYFFGFVVLLELLDGDLAALLLGAGEEHGEHEDHEHDDDEAKGATGFLWGLGWEFAILVFFGLVGLLVFGIFGFGHVSIIGLMGGDIPL